MAGAGVIGLFHYRPVITGMHTLDGIVCVLLGLYLCAHPAAYVLDLLFFDRKIEERFSSAWNAVLWAALNMLVLLIGWLVIFYRNDAIGRQGMELTK